MIYKIILEKAHFSSHREPVVKYEPYCSSLFKHNYLKQQLWSLKTDSEDSEMPLLQVYHPA